MDIISECLQTFAGQMVCNCPISTIANPPLTSRCSSPSLGALVLTLETCLQLMCDVDEPCERPMPPKQLRESYDFIVIGGGSGGATAASRLSEDERFSVLVLEAGLDEPTMAQVPSMYYTFLETDVDWQYQTEPEKRACLNSPGQRCVWPRGKVLGGTGVLHGMTYMRGTKKDYDNWAKAGNPGWSYEDVLPFFKKSEDNQQIEEMDQGYHGTGGPVTVSRFRGRPPLADAIVEAAQELGYEESDLNGRNHTGFMITQNTYRGGLRLSMSRAFLWNKGNRTNLDVKVNSTVTRIIFNANKKAVGVEFVNKGQLQFVGVKKEVVVSGGAVNSPQILLNSGVGPRLHLRSLGIPVVHHLPGVGMNLQNHVSYKIRFTIDEPGIDPFNLSVINKYVNSRSGLMSGTGMASVTGFINTKFANPKEDNPDVQLFFDGYLANCMEGDNNQTNRVIVMTPALLRPKSIGLLRLRSSDPLDKPLIYGRYFSKPGDMARLLEGVKFTLKLAETKTLQKYGFKLVTTPVRNCEHLKFGSEGYWRCAIKHETGAENHQAGSCKMGPANQLFSVVDHELKVHGLQGVRVGDTSIMPNVVSGNINAGAIMIGERVADFIRKTWAK